MTLPNYIVNGFDFDEAINLVELCQRAQQVFTHGSGSDAAEIYNLLFKGDEWTCVHAIGAKTQALILHRTATTQFALVFAEHETNSLNATQETELAQPTAQDTDPAVGVTHLTVTNEPGPTVSYRETAGSVEYPPIPDEAAPPPCGARVHEPRLRAFDALKDDIELFFDMLVDVKFAQPVLAGLGQREPTASVTTIGDALTLKFGAKVSKTALKTLTQRVEEIDAEQTLSGRTEQVTDTPAELLAKALAERPMLVDVAAGFDLYVTGHRNGGCLAALCVLYLKRRWESQLDFPLFNLKMYSFGSPKIGNKSFADYYNRNLLGFSVCVQNLMDSAIYEPAVQAPFPYNMELLLPGIDYVRCPGPSGADEYLTAYQPIEEAYQLPGIGNPTHEFNFRKPFKSLIPLPYAHDAAGYKAMLVDVYAFQRAWQKSAQQVMGNFNEQKNQLFARVTKQAGEVQKAVAQFQSKTNE